MAHAVSRLEIPKPSGLGGLMFRARWSAASADRRLNELGRLMWVPQSWQNELSTAQSLVKMRYLIDQGLWEEPSFDDPLARRLQEKAKQSAMSSLGYDALHVIKEGLPPAALHMLLETGVGADYRERGHYSDTLLTGAVRHYRPAHVDILIKAGAPLNVVDSCNCSPLRLAVKIADLNSTDRDLALHMLSKLLEAGADPNYAAHYSTHEEDRELPSTPLVEAACLGWTEGMRLLIDAGARADSRLDGQDQGRSDLLEVANNFHHRPFWQGDHAYRSFSEILDLMISAGARLDIPDKQGNTALAQAVRTGEMGIALALLDRGASIERIPGEPSLAHILCVGADFDDPYAHEFLGRMPKGFWSQTDDDGRTAFDVLKKMQDEGALRPCVEAWLALASAERLSASLVSPPTPTTRPRARL